MKMPFLDAIVSAVMGYVVVFIGLVLLMAVIALMGKVMTAKKAAPAPAAAAKAPAAGEAASETSAKTAPGSAGELKLHGVPERDAAMIMAIVADKMGKPLNELRFKSIKEVK